jgi:ribosomal protein L11 methyltransferase
VSGYVATLPCSRAEADAAALADEPFPGVEPAPTLVATEVGAPGSGDGWELHLYLDAPPGPALLAAFAALAPSAQAPPAVAALPDEDWITHSQAGLEPVDIGRFHVHTHEHAGGARPGQWPIRIDAGLAFGTGQHATTAGCIAAATRLAKKSRARNVLDVGTGSGLLAFAAHRLHRRARLTAADLDAVAVAVARDNARLNRMPAGRRGGMLELLTAPGVEHARIIGRAPYDLVFANILAGPLVALAPSVAAVVERDGYLVLAGLLQAQAARVTAAYRARGLVLVARPRHAEWPVLVFRKTAPASPRSALKAARRETAGRGWKVDSI